MPRHKIHISKKSRVLVMGLGVNNGGLSVARFFADLGCAVTITDLKSPKQLQKSLRPLRRYKNIRFVLGRHDDTDFTSHDIIFQNPAVPNNSPYLAIARRASIPITNDAAYFIQNYKGMVIGITGTRGKSTTTAILYSILREYMPNHVHLAGNIRVGFLGLLSKHFKKDIAVAEFSSWQLEKLSSIKKSPHISILTNIYPDHLNRYDSYRSYQLAKAEIFQHQLASDYLIANGDNALVRKLIDMSKSRTIFFSTKRQTNGSYLKNGVVFVFVDGKSIPLIQMEEVSLSLRPYPENILAAVTAALLFDVPLKVLIKVLRSCRGLPYRMEIIKKYHGTTVINDSCSTAPIAAVYALRSLKGSIVMISGGVDKNVSYASLARCIADKVNFLILLPGTGTDKLINELSKLDYTNYHRSSSLLSAVTFAKDYIGSHATETLLFSPAGASFNLFVNEFDRGDQFTHLIKKTFR